MESAKKEGAYGTAKYGQNQYECRTKLTLPRAFA
jgi:hypothetical protein